MTKETNWKRIAITLILILIILIITFSWMVHIGNDYNNKDSKCMNQICRVGNYDSYLYDHENKMCYCLTAGEVEHQETIT